MGIKFGLDIGSDTWAQRRAFTKTVCGGLVQCAKARWSEKHCDGQVVCLRRRLQTGSIRVVDESPPASQSPHSQELSLRTALPLNTGGAQ